MYIQLKTSKSLSSNPECSFSENLSMNEIVCQENPTTTNMSGTIKQEQQDSHSTQTNYEVPNVIIVNILKYFKF